MTRVLVRKLLMGSLLRTGTGIALVAAAGFAGRHYTMAVGALVLAGGVLGAAFGYFAATRRLMRRTRSVESLLGTISGEHSRQEAIGIPADLLVDLEALVERIGANERQMAAERADALRISHELQSLTETVRQAAHADSVDNVLQRIATLAHDDYGAVATELWLTSAWQAAVPAKCPVQEARTPRGERAFLAEVTGWDAARSSLQFARGAPVLGVIDSCSRLAAGEEHSLVWLFDWKWIQSQSIRAFAACPLIVQGEAIGVFAIFAGEPLSDIFVGMLECYAQLLALAIANGYSLSEMRRTAERLEAANLKQRAINRQLAEAGRLKSEFLTTVSHELRTPLNGILGFLSLLQDGLAATPDEQQEFVSGARTSAEHLLSLISDVLNLSEIESGRAGLDLQAFEVTEAVQSSLLAYTPAAESKGLAVSVDFPEQVMIVGDYGRLQQILRNLLDNAVKFTDHGEITVSVRTEGTQCRICVRDTGIGIDPECQHRLFQKFQQLDGSTTRHFGGTGLGLALARELTHMMSGTIGVESGGDHKGTSVYVCLPVAPPDLLDMEPPSGNGDSQSAADPLVLIVEDDVTLGRYVAGLLSKAGYSIAWATSIEDAARELQGSGPDALVLDWSLGPDCGGNGAMEFVREACGSGAGHVPGVVLTSSEEAVRRFFADEGLQPPAVALHPVDPAMLLQTVRALVQRNEQRAA